MSTIIASVKHIDINTQYITELAGTCFFAISAAIAVNEKSRPDWFSVSFISFITATGGGTFRDILLGSYPLAWVTDINFMYAILAGVLLSNIFYNHFLKFRKMMFVFDTLGVALFSIIGTEKALHYGLSPLISAMMGMFSAVMGGVLRDVLTHETPVLFRKELYASLCLAGAFMYIALEKLHLGRPAAIIISIIMVLIMRIIAVKYRLSFPRYRRGMMVSDQ